MEILPEEIVQVILQRSDRSTMVSLRLVCKRFYRLLPRKSSTDKLFTHICCLDGNFDLFALSVSWGLPLLSHYYDLAVIAECDEIVDYLSKKRIPVSQTLTRTCVVKNREDLFARFLESSKGCMKELQCIPDRDWLDKYNLGSANSWSQEDWSMKYKNYNELKKYRDFRYASSHLLYGIRKDKELFTWFLTEYYHESQEFRRLCVENDDLELLKKQLVLEERDLYLRLCICFRSVNVFNYLMNSTMSNDITRVDMLKCLSNELSFEKLELEWLFRLPEYDVLEFIWENKMHNCVSLNISNTYQSGYYDRYDKELSEYHFDLLEKYTSISSILAEVGGLLQYHTLPTMRWMLGRGYDLNLIRNKRRLLVYDLAVLKIMEKHVPSCINSEYVLSSTTTPEMCEFLHQRGLLKQIPKNRYSLAVLKWFAENNIPYNLKRYEKDGKEIRRWLMAR
jgi:hypothetical protein